MELALPFGTQKIQFTVPFPLRNLAAARCEAPPKPGDWKDLAARALDSPIGAGPLHGLRRGIGKAAILVAPGFTAAPVVLPIIIDQLRRTGVPASDIAIILACGDEPAAPGEPLATLGPELAREHACAAHDAFAGGLRFRGFTALGAPVFLNLLAAEAEFIVAVGTVQPHPWYGYSGGAQEFLPGICGAETIARNDGLGFSAGSAYGSLGTNPCRLEMESAAAANGLKFVLDFVLSPDGRPLAAFAGDPLKAHRAAVNWGDRAVWGAELGGPADAAIASPGHDWPGDRPFDPRALDYVAAGIKPGGTIVCLASRASLPRPRRGNGPDLARASIADLAKLHEKRTWPGDPRRVHAGLHAVREAYLARRPFNTRSVILAGSDLSWEQLELLNAEQADSLQEAVEMLVDRHGEDARVALVPDALTTLCLPEFH